MFVLFGAALIGSKLALLFCQRALSQRSASNLTGIGELKVVYAIRTAE